MRLHSRPKTNCDDMAVALIAHPAAFKKSRRDRSSSFIMSLSHLRRVSFANLKPQGAQRTAAEDAECSKA
jgi:hypothetical protein